MGLHDISASRQRYLQEDGASMGKRGPVRERAGGNEVRWMEASGNGVDLRGFTPVKARLREKKEEEEEAEVEEGVFIQNLGMPISHLGRVESRLFLAHGCCLFPFNIGHVTLVPGDGSHDHCAQSKWASRRHRPS